MTERSSRLRAPRRAHHDVVFYMPFIGWILSANATVRPGGAETQILAIARGLAKLGVRARSSPLASATSCRATSTGFASSRALPRARTSGL